MSIADNYKRVHEEVATQAERCGRNSESVKLVAVSKTVDAFGVDAAYSVGARDFGENRPDPLVEKAGAFPQANWHFIGNIQSRHIKDIVRAATLIHSVHEARHARKISEEAAKLGKTQRILLEVNVSGEESKSGVSAEEVCELLEFCEELQNVQVCGLMTMAPQGSRQVAQEVFRGLAELAENLRKTLNEERARVFTELSMGMSEDWREAIAEGATLVRIGRAIFSDSFEG